jgi:uncharacterized phiE125 gp8 family phage protein
MSLRLITGPVGYPISLSEAKAHCRIDGSSDDDLLTAYIAAATSHIEQIIGKAILSQTWEMLLDDFSDAMPIPKGPVASVTSIKYYDTDSALQTLDTTVYSLDLTSEPQWVVRAEDESWPEVAEGVNNVIIRFVAGYTTTPPELKLALMLTVGYFYDHRSTGDIPDIVMSLLTNFRSGVI